MEALGGERVVRDDGVGQRNWECWPVEEARIDDLRADEGPVGGEFDAMGDRSSPPFYDSQPGTNALVLTWGFRHAARAVAGLVDQPRDDADGVGDLVNSCMEA